MKKSALGGRRRDWTKASPPPGMNWGNCRIEKLPVAAQYQAELQTKVRRTTALREMHCQATSKSFSNNFAEMFAQGKYFHARDKAAMWKGLGVDL